MMEIKMIVRDTISARLDYKLATTALAVEHVFQSGASEIEQYAQFNAPWEDQTGAARAGLHTDVGFDGGDYSIALIGGVDYQIYLELKDDGKYAIIMPTLEALGPKIIHEAAAAVILL